MFQIFDRTPPRFNFNDIPDLNGKVVIVTGANTGIGYSTARELAHKKAHVFVAGRNPETSKKAVEEIKQITGNEKVEFLPVDLSSLKSVKRGAELFLDRKLPLHILINNAGIMGTPFSLTEDGIQDQFGTNHIGHFLFTKLLLPKIEASAPSRIVNVTSMAHLRAPECGIDFENLNDPDAYNTWSRYSQSKLANILFSLELDKRLANKEVYVNSVHPGIIFSELCRNIRDSMGIVGIPATLVVRLFSRPTDEGAITPLYCATSPEIVEEKLRGKYFIPFAKLSETSKAGTDEKLAKKLWEFSEELVNEKLKN